MHYLISTAGHPNVGDELITRVWLREIAARAPDADVWLDCPNPSGAQALFADEHPRLRCVDTLFRLCWEAPSESPWDVAAFVSAALDDHGLAPRWVPGLQVLARAESVHLLGGGYVNAIWGRHVGLLAVLDWAARRGVRTAATGQGLMPCSPDAATLVRSLLERVEEVEVRDEPSAALLGRPGTWGGDDLWLADRDSLLDAERAADLDAVVCVQGDLLEVEEGWLTSRCLEQLRRWDVDPARTAVVECIPRVDRGVFDRLRPLLPGLQFVPWFEVLERGLPAAAGQRWFSSRFHPHLMAAWAGARGVAVGVHEEYYGVKHASLLRVGTGWQIADRRDRPADPPPARARAPRGESPEHQFHRNVERIRERKQRLTDEFYGPLPHLRRLAPVRALA